MCLHMELSQSEVFGVGASNEVNPLCFSLGDTAAKVMEKIKQQIVHVSVRQLVS